ncbi:MAG: NAD(P)/FAD-dependent oxidoreductase [Candidatus Omnitrophota bacterium]
MPSAYDLIVIGAGPAGITAGVYAARKRMKVLVVSKDIGGQAAISGEVENYTGYQFITGPELAEKFAAHMRRFDIELKINETVVDLKKNNDIIEVIAESDKYLSRSVIVATGKRSRELSVPGEKEFRGRGLTYCATCDGPLFSGKDVLVVGGGNSALDAALQLVKIARRVYIVNTASRLAGDKILREKVASQDKVSLLNDSYITEIFGDKVVFGVKMRGRDGELSLAVQGVFVEIGLIPNSEFAGILDKNERGEIKTDKYNRTNIAGIFAAGDVSDIPEKQIIIAAGDGSKASLSAFGYLLRNRSY